jgi:hypothetical protein
MRCDCAPPRIRLICCTASIAIVRKGTSGGEFLAGFLGKKSKTHHGGMEPPSYNQRQSTAKYAKGAKEKQKIEPQRAQRNELQRKPLKHRGTEATEESKLGL